MGTKVEHILNIMLPSKLISGSETVGIYFFRTLFL